MDHVYNNIRILLATKHRKELAIRQPFEEAFSANIFVPNDFDTDQFGTFSIENPRVGTAYETVIKKAKYSCEIYGYHYAIANEGSFGPHPLLYFTPGDVELMSFVDMINDIIIVESEISGETNFSHLDITIADDYNSFLTKINFGSHGLILTSLDNNKVIAKGVNEINQLKILLSASFREYQKIRLETDMRAMMNPTRMRVINRLAVKLAARLKNICKQCNSPGFGKLSFADRLLCADCSSESELYRYRVFECIKCDYKEYADRSDNLTESDPRYCLYCNP